MRASPVAQALVLGGASSPAGLDERLVFASEKLAEDALFIGNPWIELNVSVDQPRGSIEAKLYEVDAKNGSRLVSVGWQNLATRTSRDEGEDVPTGETMPVRILMTGLAQVVEKGSILELVLSPQSTETLTPHAQATTFTFTLGGEDARLWLPAVTPANP